MGSFVVVDLEHRFYYRLYCRCFAEQFAGAEATYTIESLMHDGKALQSGTSHNFGDGFGCDLELPYCGAHSAVIGLNRCLGI